MDMIAVSAEQEIADETPRSLGARPGAEQLNRVAVRLRTAAVTLQRLVQTPAEVFLFAGFAPEPAIERISRAGGAGERLLPAAPPRLDPAIADAVDVGGPTNLVMTKNSGPEQDL